MCEIALLHEKLVTGIGYSRDAFNVWRCSYNGFASHTQRRKD